MNSVSAGVASARICKRGAAETPRIGITQLSVRNLQAFSLEYFEPRIDAVAPRLSLNSQGLLFSTHTQYGSSNQTRSQSRRMGNDRHALRLRALSSRQPLRSNDKGRLRLRMQSMHATVHTLQMESRSQRAPKAYHHLLNMRSAQELLSVLYA